MQAGSVISLSPSFNSYSNTRLAGVAARVAGEFGSEEFQDEFHFVREQDSGDAGQSIDRDENDDGFEFAFVGRDSELPSPVSADEIFHNGQIRPFYPVFNRDLFPDEKVGDEAGSDSRSGKRPDAIRLSLRKLFIEERETAMTRTTSSSSSSETDELEGVPEETYCVWRPNEAAAEGLCDKSNSTGSTSKRWKFRDLLPRSHSDGGKERFVFFTPSISGRRKGNEEKVKRPTRAGNVKSAGGEKRRSYLPYRQDLVGLFPGATVNASSKNIQPF